MTKKIVIPCVVGGQVEPVDFFIGKPAEGSDPIHFQSKWLNNTKKGSVPPHIMKALLELQQVAVQAGISFEDLCEMTFNKVQQTSTTNQSPSTTTKGSS
jgi:hypothetical protein